MVIARECGHVSLPCSAGSGSGLWVLGLVLIRGDTAQAHGKWRSSQSTSQSYKTLRWMDAPTQPTWGMENWAETWPIITSLALQGFREWKMRYFSSNKWWFWRHVNGGFGGTWIPDEMKITMRYYECFTLIADKSPQNKDPNTDLIQLS